MHCPDLHPLSSLMYTSDTIFGLLQDIYVVILSSQTRNPRLCRQTSQPKREKESEFAFRSGGNQSLCSGERQRQRSTQGFPGRGEEKAQGQLVPLQTQTHRLLQRLVASPGQGRR